MQKEPHFLYDSVREERDKLFDEIKKTVNKKPHHYNTNAIILRKLIMGLIRASGGKFEQKEVRRFNPYTQKQITQPQIIQSQPIQIQQPQPHPQYTQSTKLTDLNEIPIPTRKTLTAPKPTLRAVSEYKEQTSLEEKELIKSKQFKDQYPILISKISKKVLATAVLDFREDKLVYTLIEPELNHTDQIILHEIKQDILRRNKFKLIYNEKYLDKMLNKLAKKYSVQVDPNYKEKISYYLKRDLIGLGKIEPLLKDANVKAIFCNGVSKLITINYQAYENVKTNVVFTDEEELDYVVKKFGEQVKVKLTEKDPILDSMLPSGVRVQATLGSSFVSSKFVINR